MKIPKRLNHKDIRFIKLRGRTKKALEKGWTTTANYSFEEISEWNNQGNNYGIACGYGDLIVIDCDLEILDKRVSELLPSTFVVQTGSGGKHYYYFVPEYNEKILGAIKEKKAILYYNGTIHAGEAQSQNFYVVAPGSIHPDTEKEYKVLVDEKIATITPEELLPLVKEFENEEKPEEETSPSDSHQGFNLDISKVIEAVPELQDFKESEDSIQGIHPVHGSSTKFNFNINLEQSIWHCFRCGTGGDALHLIAMLEGLIDCSDVGKKKVKGEDFCKLLKIAKKKYGYTDDELQKEELPEEPKSLDEVHETFQKYLYIDDLKPIDLALAVALTSQKKGTPVWMIFMGASSGCKSTILRSLSDVPKAMLLDDITENTLASGARDPKTNKKVPDLGLRLSGKSTLIITPDLSSMTSHNKDAKRKIWSKFRELFDGFINRETGNNTTTDYKDCHVTWLFGATPSVRSEVLVYAQMGTRELIYEFNLPSSIDDKVMEKAWDNENYEEEMKKALIDVVRKFYKSHTYQDDTVISNDMKEFIKSEAKRLEYLRASAPMDRQAELLTVITPAKPYRAMKQLKKVCIGLKSLDSKYSDQVIRGIIRNIVDSTSDPIRTAIMHLHEENRDDTFTYKDYINKLKVSRHVVKHQAMALWNMGYLTREFKYKYEGAKVADVAYFKKSTKTKFKFVR